MTIYHGGLQILREGRIALEVYNPVSGRWHFKVMANTPGKTLSVIIEKQGKVSCTCEHGSIYVGYLCRHIIAAVMYLGGVENYVRNKEGR